MLHNLRGVNDAQVDREVKRVKAVIVAHQDYLERLLREQRHRKLLSREIDQEIAEALGEMS